MYRDKFIYGLMAASALFAACSDDFGVADGPKHPVSEGDEILFGAKNLATFKDGFTDDAEKGGRTVYGDAEYVQNADGTGGYWKYPLSWIYGDSISVYSPEATYPNDGGKGFANYEVHWDGGAPGDTATNNSSAYLVKMDENGLHWGDPNTEHTFYAFYPKSLIDNDDSFINGGGYLDAEIPKYQPMVKWEKKTTEDGKTRWVGLPDMNLCLMRAVTKVKPNDIAAGTPVELDFEPLTTAVEVTLIADNTGSATADQLQMLHVRGKSKDGTQTQCICGEFTYDINNGQTTSLNQDIANDYEISVPLWVEGEKGPEPLTLSPGEEVTLTVFLLPQAHGTAGLSENSESTDRSLVNLQFEVVSFNGGTRVKSYDAVNIPQGTKSQVVLPKYTKVDGALNNWMSRIPNKVYVSQLSIPGAAEAFSTNVITSRGYYGKDEEHRFAQDLSVSDLFDKGVRAFDIATRTKGIAGLQSLADASLSCGDEDGYTFGKAISDIADKLEKNPSEFAVVTVYYARDISDWSVWVSELDNFLTSDNMNTYKIKAFSNNMTVEEARGHILLMARANADEASSLAGKVPVINGWNSMKDKWMRRGYNIRNSNYFLDADKVDAWTGNVNQWNGNGNPKDAEYTLPLSTDADAWKYTTLGSLTSAHIQEWRRVCPESKEYEYDGPSWFGSDKTYWYESMPEKKLNVINFFGQTKRALKDNPNVTALYINSLDGYYIISNGNSYSAAPNSNKASKYGVAGNIVDYAADMNDYVYQHMLSVPYESRGPVGIVYFDFAGVEQFGSKTMHGDYLLKTLIGNNFTFPLMGKAGE